MQGKEYNISRLFVVAFLVLTLVPAVSAENDPDLVARWKLNEATGTVVHDSVGANNGNLINGPTWAPGIVGDAPQLDGVDDCIDTRDIDLPDSFSLTLWANPYRISSGQCLIGKHTGKGLNLFLLGIGDGGYAVTLRSTQHTLGPATTGWQHLGVVVEEADSGSIVTLYKNGNMLSSQTYPDLVGDLSGKAWTMGQEWDGDVRSDFFQGQICDVRIYRKALTQNEVEEAADGILDATSMPILAMGGIPSKMVWHGSEYSFLLEWQDHTNVSYTFETLPTPMGMVSLAPAFAGALDHWKFHYVPDSTDITSFTVTVTADDGNETMKQSFDIIPSPVLPPEQVVFDSTDHTNSGPMAIDDLVVYDPNGLPSLPMNYQTSPVRRVRIIGEEVVFEPGHQNGLYEKYGGRRVDNNGKRNIESIEITAETVTIRDELWLPQTNVVINARELRFDGPEAKIVTTPWELTGSPGTESYYDGSLGQTRTRGAAGAQGLSSGPVTLNIGSLTTTHGGVKFDLHGGKGQQAGPGSHGVNGVSVSYRDSYTFQGIVSGTYTNAEGYKITYVEEWEYFLVPVRLNATWGAKAWPISGTDAQESGRPGNGGNGGQLVSTIDVAEYTGVSAGAAGDPAPGSVGGAFRGGSAGSPQKAVQIYCYYTPWSVWFPEIARYDTVAGRTYNLITATNGTAGAILTPDFTGGTVDEKDDVNPFARICPNLMNQLLQKAKNEYLDGRLDVAYGQMESLRDEIRSYVDDPLWNNLDMMEQGELQKIYDEISTLLLQMESNMDYFGNPAGWVPMLSLESYMTAFENEIDYAIDALYLAYWIKNVNATQEQKLAALSEMRDLLQKQINQAGSDFDEAIARIPALKSRGAQIRHDTEQAIVDIQTLETQLEQDARNNLREPWWKFTLKMTAQMCTMVPMFQPAAGFVRDGLNIGLDWNASDPYGNVIKITQLADTIEKTALDKAATAVKIGVAAATGSVGDAVEAAFEDVSKSRVSYTTSLQGIMGVLKGVEAPAEKIQAELARLKKTSPEFKSLCEKVDALNRDQAQYARDLIDAVATMASLADLVTESLVAMDALRDDLSGVETLDPRAAMYLDNLERRAFDRLLKYHYYMAKAYEYRLLEPYDQPLDLQSLFEELGKTKFDSQGSVTPHDEFETLKSIYIDTIRTVVGKILEEYTYDTPELSAPVRFSLTADELAQINDGRTVRINLFDLGIFPSYAENIRIYDLKVIAIDTVPVDGDYDPNGNIKIKIAHSGESKLMCDGQTYLFRHYTDKTENPLTWGTIYYPADADTDPVGTPIRPSAASTSLLRTLLGDGAPADMMLYSRPSAWADLNVSTEVFNNAGKDIDVTRLRLELQYDYTERRDSLGLASVKLQVSEANPDDQNGLHVSEGGFTPYFVVGEQDINGRQDARGEAHRIYVASSFDPVDVTAQKKFGNWKFNKWTDQYHNDLPDGPVTDRTITLYPSADLVVMAQYVSSETLAGDLNSDCKVDFEDLSLLVNSWTQVHPSLNLDSGDTIGTISQPDLTILVSNWNKTCEQVLRQARPASKGAESKDTTSTTADERNIEYVR